MNQIILISVLATICGMTYGQINVNPSVCPSGMYQDVTTLAMINRQSPILALNGVTYYSSSTVTNAGFYSGKNATQCCYNCQLSANAGAGCASWAFDSCTGRCYLSGVK